MQLRLASGSVPATTDSIIYEQIQQVPTQFNNFMTYTGKFIAGNIIYGTAIISGTSPYIGLPSAGYNYYKTTFTFQFLGI